MRAATAAQCAGVLCGWCTFLGGLHHSVPQQGAFPSSALSKTNVPAAPAQTAATHRIQVG